MANRIGEDISDDQKASLILAWACSWGSSLGGNEVALVKNLQLVGAGGGPATTIAATNSIQRAKEQTHVLEGSVFAADAFFPFTDAPDLLSQAGCVAGIVPRGGKYENDVRLFFEKNNMTIYFIPQQYRGFCRH